MTARVAAIVVLGWLAGVPAAHAGASRSGDAEPGGLVYASDDALWWRQDDGKGDRTQLATLPAPGPVAELAIDDGGHAAIVRVGDVWTWSSLRTGKSAPLECRGTARISKNGRCIVCTGKDGRALLYVSGPTYGAPTKRVLPGDGQPVGFGRGGRLVVRKANGDLVLTTALRERETVLARSAPTGSIWINPVGYRAVGQAGKDDPDHGGGLYTFKLDGKGAKRHLLQPATAVVWSTDSRWLVVNQDSQDSKDSDGCLVRGMGGEYKCWDHYRAVAVSGDGSVLYLVREREDKGTLDLYRVETKGAHNAKPQEIVRDVDPAAVWTRWRPQKK